MQVIEQEVISIVSRIAKVPEAHISSDTDLRTDLNVDSLQGLQIVAILEDKFGVTIPDEELDMYTSIRSIVETIERLQ